MKRIAAAPATAAAEELEPVIEEAPKQPATVHSPVLNESEQTKTRTTCMCDEVACDEDGVRLRSLDLRGSTMSIQEATLPIDVIPRSLVDAALARAHTVGRMYPRLTLDECAAVVLFTSDTPISMSPLVNAALLDTQRLPAWLEYIRLLLHALSKLPPCPIGTAVTRGCAKSPQDLGIAMVPADGHGAGEWTWAGFAWASTCKPANFFASFLARLPCTMWCLEITQPIARDLRDFALDAPLDSTADWVLLPPGVSFEVLTAESKHGTHVLRCRQLEVDSLLDLAITGKSPAPPPAPAPSVAPLPASGSISGSISAADLASVGLSPELMEVYRGGEECAFWFVKADELRTLSPAALPRMQALRAERPHWLVRHVIRFVDLCAGMYRGEFLVISHRWEEAAEPDRSGTQAATVQEHLRRHTAVRLVWYGTCLVHEDAAVPRAATLC